MILRKRLLIIILCFLLFTSFAFSQSDSTGKPNDSFKNAGQMHIKQKYSGRGTFMGGSAQGQHYDRYKEKAVIDGKEMNINRKNLNPYFKTVPAAYKNWNAYYTYSYIELITLTGGIVGGFGFVFSEPKNPALAACALTGIISSVILSKVARAKRGKAITLYNKYHSD